VARSLKKYGWRKPIVVTDDGRIWAGDTRFLASLLLRLTAVPVYVTTLDELKARGFRLDDNRTGDFSDWDFPGLHLEVRALEALGVQPDDLSFDADELAGLADRAAEAELAALAASDPEQQTPPVPAAPGSTGLVTFHLLVRPTQKVTILAAAARAKHDRRLPLTADALVQIVTEWRDRCPPIPSASPVAKKPTASETPPAHSSTRPTNSRRGGSTRSTARGRPTSRRGKKAS
jgi:hypothetical protein